VEEFSTTSDAVYYETHPNRTPYMYVRCREKFFYNGSMQIHIFVFKIFLETATRMMPWCGSSVNNAP